MEEDLINLQYKDLSLLCRICLKQRKDLVNIFKASFHNVKITDVLQELFAEKIKQNDGKPEQLCYNCILQTMQVNDFVNMYYKSKKSCEKWLEWKNTNLPVDVEEIQDPESFITVEMKDTNTTKIIKVIPVKEQEKFNVYMSDYICNLCGYDFRTDPCTKNKRKSIKLLKDHTLKDHLIEISGQCNSYKCLKCDIELKLFSEVKTHFSSDLHQNKECLICKSVFNSVKDCFHHMKSCRENEWLKKLNNEDYKCVLCNNLDIHGFENVLEHHKMAHEKQINCLICRQRFAAPHMEMHLYKHRPRRMKYFCLICLKDLKTPALLADHKRNFHLCEKTCEICQMAVPSRLYSQHMACHNNDAHICEFCGKSFRGWSSLKRHYNSQHLARRFYCDQQPLNRISSVSPDVTKKPTKGLFYTCNICDKKIRRGNKRQIKLHEMFHINCHTVMCFASQCELTFANKEDRLKHMISDHQQFTCEICNKSFFNFNNYKLHCLLHIWQNNHSNLKTFCRICNENQPDIGSLRSHVLNQHNLHFCSKEDCGEIFENKPALQKHYDNMHVEFPCTICNKKFPSSAELSIHNTRLCLS